MCVLRLRARYSTSGRVRAHSTQAGVLGNEVVSFGPVCASARALGAALLGPRGVRLLVSEVPLYACRTLQRHGSHQVPWLAKILLFFFITLGLEMSDTKVYEP